MNRSVAAVPPDLSEVGSLLVVALTGRLRSGGVPVSTSEVLDAISALGHTDLTSRGRVSAALRATLIKDTSHDVLFRRSFDAVFPTLIAERPSGAPSSPSASTNDAEDGLRDAMVRALRAEDEAGVEEALGEAIERFAGNSDDGRSAGHHTQRVLRRMNVADLYRRYLEAGDDANDFERGVGAASAKAALDQMNRRLTDMVAGRLREGSGVSAQQLEDLQDRPLLRAGADELAAMRVAMRPLARHLAAKLSARRRRGGSGVDMRRTIRASMGYGGVPAAPVLRRRRPTKPDLVVLCDVSGSTAQFAPFTLTLLHALHDEFRRVRSFVFIDGIVEITDHMEANPGVVDPRHLLGGQGLIAEDGRSDYARAMTTFLATWGSSVTAKTTVIIAGDARSHDREAATSVVAEISRRARRLYWLNPEPRAEWDALDSRASEYSTHCTNAFEVSTIRQLTAAVTQIV